MFTAQLLQTHTHTHTGWPRVGLNPSGKKKLLLCKGRLTTNLYTKLETLALSSRVTRAWSERVNFYSRQIMIHSFISIQPLGRFGRNQNPVR